MKKEKSFDIDRALMRHPLILFSIIFWILQLLIILSGYEKLILISAIDFLIFLHFILWFYIGKYNRDNENFINAFFGPLTSLLIFVILYFFTGLYGLMGGIIWGDLCLIFAMLNILFSISLILIQLFKKTRLNDAFLKNKGHSYEKYRKIFVRSSLLILILILISPVFLNGFNYYFGDPENDIGEIVERITADATNETEKLYSIIRWFNRTEDGTDHIANMYYRGKDDKILLYIKGLCYIFNEPPHFCFRLDADNPEWIISSRCGMCGEYATLFGKMASSTNLTVRKVISPGENHAWNEVFLSELNDWVIIDATSVKLPDPNGYKSSDFMEKKAKGNVSYIYAEYFDGRENEDITHRYTEITNISVFVTDENGMPLSNVKVELISKNRDNYPRNTGLSNYTNDSGKCKFTIGGGNYIFKAKTDDFIPLYGEASGSFSEDKVMHNITLDVKQDWTKNEFLFYTVLAIILLIFLIMYIYYKRRKKKFNDKN